MRLPYLTIIALTTIASIALTACHDLPEMPDNPSDPASNFDQLWTILDEHYCFFAQKDVDWDEVYKRYSIRVSPEMSQEELFDVCAAMLDELQDGHTNLSAPFNT